MAKGRRTVEERDGLQDALVGAQLVVGGGYDDVLEGSAVERIKHSVGRVRLDRLFRDGCTWAQEFSRVVRYVRKSAHEKAVHAQAFIRCAPLQKPPGWICETPWLPTIASPGSPTDSVP